MKCHRSSSLVRTSALSLLVGGGVGFAVGLLVAPDRGERLRRRFAFRFDQAAAEVERLIDGMMHTGHARAARDQGRALVSDAEAEASRIRGDIDRILHEQRQRKG